MRLKHLLLLALGASSFAQNTQTVDSSPRVGVSIVERQLSLADALQIALKHNLELEVERTNQATAAQAVIAARGFFDPRFLWTPFLESRATPVANVLAAPNGKLNEHFFNQNFSFLQPTEWNGLQYRVDFLNSRQSTSNPFTGLTPFYQTGLTASISKPLLRNRITDQYRTELLVRRKLSTSADVDYETRVIDILTRVQTAYWDLVAALQDVRVEDDGVKLAREQLARNQRMISAGTLAPVELAASEAELQRRLDSYISSVGVVTIAENNLKLLLAPDRENELWGERIVPTERAVIEPEKDDLKSSMDLALARRPELRSISIRKEINEVQQNFAKDQVKPQVNLVAAYTNAGLAGAQVVGGNPFGGLLGAQAQRINELSAMAGLAPLPPADFGSTPASLLGGYGQSLSNLFGGGYQGVQVGLQIDWNIRNRTATAQLAQTNIADRRIKLQRIQLSQSIEAEVRNALQGVQTARQRIQAAQAAERASQEKLDSEVRLFQTGESTNFLVLTRQNEMLDSRRRSVQATLLLNKASAVLARATGTTLDANNVKLQ